MNNGIIFNTDTPTMDGHWYNPGTDDNFTVKDTFFEDGQYKVLTTDGRLLGYEQIQYYVKVDKPIQKTKTNDSIPSNILNEIENLDQNDLLLEDDMKLINGSLGSIYKEYPTETHMDTDIVVLDKALNKNTLPDIQVSIKWKDFPKSEINMVSSLLDISMDKVVSWYINKIDISDIKSTLNNALENYIIKNIKEEQSPKKPANKTNKK